MTDTLAEGAETGTVANADAAGAAAGAAAAATEGNAGAAAAGAAGATAEAAEAAKGGAGAETTGNVAGIWPDDWRQKLAGDDKKALERLGRYASPNDIWKATEEAQRKISEGLKPKDKPGPKATDEEWAAYRKDAGIPDTVEDFVKAIELPDKRQIGDEDRPMVEAFAERALKRGVAPGDMAELVDEYYRVQEEQVALQDEKDAEFRSGSMQALREEMGGDFNANIKAMRPYFDAVNPELYGNLFGGRMADGSKVGDHPDIVRFFVAKSLSENPAATIVPAGSGQIDTINGEIATLEKRMGEDRNGWFKDQEAQQRYQKLIAARDKLSAK